MNLIIGGEAQAGRPVNGGRSRALAGSQNSQSLLPVPMARGNGAGSEACEKIGWPGPTPAPSRSHALTPQAGPSRRGQIRLVWVTGRLDRLFFEPISENQPNQRKETSENGRHSSIFQPNQSQRRPPFSRILTTWHPTPASSPTSLPDATHTHHLDHTSSLAWMQCTSAAIPQLPNRPSTFGRLTARPAPIRWFSQVEHAHTALIILPGAGKVLVGGASHSGQEWQAQGGLLRAWQAWQA